MRSVSPKAAKRYEAKQLARYRKWHARRPGRLARLAEWVTTPVAMLFHRIISPSAVEATLHGNMAVARRWARHRTTLRQLGVTSHTELAQAELLHSDRVVRKIHRRAVWLAGFIGLASGTFGIFGLPLGIAGTLNLALRTIHRVGLSYGYPAESEAERLFVYYTLSLAGHREPAEKAKSLEALRELQARITSVEAEMPTPVVDDSIRRKAFTIAHHDFSREITKQLISVRLLMAIPGIGGIIGIIVDTNYMRSVGWAARHAYQLRWLRERGRLPDPSEA